MTLAGRNQTGLGKALSNKGKFPMERIASGDALRNSFDGFYGLRSLGKGLGSAQDISGFGDLAEARHSHIG